jgi:sugar phosphate isomerase/epimerase
MKFGICNEIFQDWPLDEAFAYAASVGYDCIEIAPFTIAKSVLDIPTADRQQIKDLAPRNGIAISGIHWVLVQTEGLHLTHPDPETRARTARYFVDLVDFCASIGGTRIIVGSPKQRSLQSGVTYDRAWEFATNVFRDSVRHAEDRGVVICFEPLAPSETDFVNTAAEGIRFAQQFNSPAMSIILDVKAMSSEGKPVPDIIRASAGKFEYFHANDPNLKGPGFGDTDFGPIAAALRDSKYDGVVSVEVFKFEEGAEVIASRSIEYLRKAFAA